MLDASDGLRFLFCFSIRFVVSRPVGTTMRCLPMLNCLVLSREWGNGLIMETTIGDYTAPNIGTTIGIHSPFPTKHQTVHPDSLAGFHDSRHYAGGTSGDFRPVRCPGGYGLLGAKTRRPCLQTVILVVWTRVIVVFPATHPRSVMKASAEISNLTRHCPPTSPLKHIACYSLEGNHVAWCLILETINSGVS